jgi:hypothetical protein
MIHQNESNLDLLVPFLLDFQEELLDLIEKKYGEQAVGSNRKENQLFRTAHSSFAHAMVRFSGDPDLKVAIARRYWECGRILGIISGNHSITGIFFEMLDEKSRLILMTLSKRGYATLDELSVAAQSTHYEVLQRLREVINPLSIRQFGKPFAVFMESNSDPLTGEKILFSWWLNQEFSHEPDLVEVTEEDESIYLTTKLAGLDLPRSMRATATFNHGILEVTVQKGGPSDGR